jgi:putative ABC transport system permease protein
VPITPAKLAEVSALDHIRGVRGTGLRYGRVLLNGRAEHADIASVLPGDERIRERLVLGSMFDAADAREVVVGEFLLYSLGVVDDADVERAIGGKIRLEVQDGGPSPWMLLNYLNPGASAESVDDVRLLQKLADQLPEAVGKLDLSAEEKSSLQRLLKKPKEKPRPRSADVLAEEFTIRGVIKAVPADGPMMWRDWERSRAELILPARTGEDFYFRMPRGKEQGLDHLIVEVDTTENVRVVSAQIKDMGLRADSLVEQMDVERFVYTLIFAAMSVVAGVSLLVAALGITNTMLMSVLERVREIGVMKAVGAKDTYVQAIFLIEGALIGAVGGGLGVLMGWLLKFPGDAWVRSVLVERTKIQLEESVFSYPLWLVLGAPAFAAAVTTLAAVYPARRAARVNPVTALRHE